MVTKDIKIAYSEVLAIINLMEEKYKNKIPNSVLQIFKDEKKENYNSNKYRRIIFKSKFAKRNSCNFGNIKFKLLV